MNPVPYQQLFDIDGLKGAIQETEKATDEFSTAAVEDFKRMGGAAASLRKEIEKINATISANPIRLSDEAGQQQVQAFASQIANLTKQYKDQQASIAALNGVLASNKQAVSDAKTQAAQYQAQLQQQKVATESVKTSIAQTTLEMKQLSQANQQAKQAVTAANGSYKEAQQRLTALGKSIKEAEGGFRSASPAIQAQIAQYNQLNDKLKAFDAQMGNHQRNVGNYTDSIVDGLTHMITGWVSLAAAIELAHKVFETALETDANRTSLGYILGDVDLANQKLDMLKDTAHKYGLEFVSLTKAYNTFTGAAKAVNFSLSDSDKIFQSVARASGIMHLSSDETSGALRALSRMMETGRVSARYLQNELGIRIPQATAAMADALNIPVAKLHELEKQGGIISSEVLPKFAESLTKLVGKGVTDISSLQASWERLKNTFTETVDENNRIKSFFEGLIDGVTTVASTISKIVNTDSWKEFFVRMGSLGAGLVGSGAAAGIEGAADAIHTKPTAFTNQFRNASRPEQVSQIQTQAKIRDNAYREYEKNKNAENLKYLNEQQILLRKLQGIYSDLYAEKKKFDEVPDADLNSVTAIRQRIIELNKLPNSATKGSDVEQRIEALKKRLHELAGSTKVAKDGFQILEAQIKKTMLLLQDSIIQDYAKHQGKESENTKKLADAYNNLNEKLIKLRALQFDAIHGKMPNPGKNGNPNDKIDTSRLDKVSNIANLLQDQNTDANAITDTQSDFSKMKTDLARQYQAKELTRIEFNARMLQLEKGENSLLYGETKKLYQDELELAKVKYGENSTEYRNLLLKLSKLDEQHTNDSIAQTEKEIAAKKAIYDDIFNSIKANGAILAEQLGSNFGKFFSDFTNQLESMALGATATFEDFAALGMDATNAYTDHAINASKDRQAALEREMAYEVEGAGKNAIAKKLIQDQFTKRINDEKRKQAIIAKEGAIIDIAINTAVAASKTLGVLGPFGIPLLPVIIGLGAIEAGLVAAQPLPAYEKGRKGGKGEFALVNERGPEAIGRGGNLRIANSGKKGITWINKGEDVHTAHETNHLFLTREIEYSTNNANEVSKSKAIYDNYIMRNSGQLDPVAIGKAVGEEIKNMPVSDSVWDERGHATYRRQGATRIKSVRDRNSL